jgi:hypothetical protein
MTKITNVAEAEKAVDDVAALIEKLALLMQEEMALVHAGRVRKAAALGEAKSALAGALYVAGERLKASAEFVRRAAPARCAALQSLQEKFRAVLQKNLVVLATAHAVSESIMRRLSGDLARKASLQVYGSTGRATAPNPRAGRPLALSRTL